MQHGTMILSRLRAKDKKSVTARYCSIGNGNAFCSPCKESDLQEAPTKGCFRQIRLIRLDLQHVPEGDDLEPFFFKLRDLSRQKIQRVLPVMPDSDGGALLPCDPSQFRKLGLYGIYRIIVIKKNTAFQKGQPYRVTNFRSD